MGLKWCYKCQQNKTLSEFYKNKTKKDGLRDECKICHKEYMYNSPLQKIYRKKFEESYKHTPIRKATKKNSTNRRRAQIKTTDITTEFLIRLNEFSVFCPKCGVEMNEIQFHPNSKHLDHLIGLAIGGLHSMKNVRYICQTCNLKRPKDCSDIL